MEEGGMSTVFNFLLYIGYRKNVPNSLKKVQIFVHESLSKGWRVF